MLVELILIRSGQVAHLLYKTLWKTFDSMGPVMSVGGFWLSFIHSGSKQTNRQEALFALWLTSHFYVTSVWAFSCDKRPNTLR